MPLATRDRLRVCALLMAGSLAPSVAPAQQVDQQDPYGLNPAPPKTDTAPKPAAETKKTPSSAPAPGPSVSGTSVNPADIEKLLQDKGKSAAQTQAKKALDEENLLRSLSDGIPVDCLGVTLPEIPGFPVEDVLEDPTIFEGQHLRLSGVVRRACKTGCWVDVAQYKSAEKGIRIIPGAKEWIFQPTTRERRVVAYGELKKRYLDTKAAKAVDEQAGDKSRGARTEWYMEAEGAEVSWLN